MKKGTTPTIPIEHDLDMSTVTSVEFLFKQEKLETAPVIIKKTYPGDVTEAEGVFNIPFTEDETRMFKSGRDFYCDPKITLVNGKIPETEILSIHCTPTLWGEDDD